MESPEESWRGKIEVGCAEHLDALVDAGTGVLVVDDLTWGARANFELALGCGARLIQLDSRDGLAVERGIPSFRPELLFYLLVKIDMPVSARSCLLPTQQ